MAMEVTFYPADQPDLPVYSELLAEDHGTVLADNSDSPMRIIQIACMSDGSGEVHFLPNSTNFDEGSVQLGHYEPHKVAHQVVSLAEGKKLVEPARLFNIEQAQYVSGMLVVRHVFEVQPSLLAGDSSQRDIEYQV